MKDESWKVISLVAMAIILSVVVLSFGIVSFIERQQVQAIYLATGSNCAVKSLTNIRKNVVVEMKCERPNMEYFIKTRGEVKGIQTEMPQEGGERWTYIGIDPRESPDRLNEMDGHLIELMIKGDEKALRVIEPLGESEIKAIHLEAKARIFREGGFSVTETERKELERKVGEVQKIVE